MALISFSNIVDGTTIDAADVNSPLNIIYNDYNGNIDNTNIKDSAITGAKIAAATITPDKVAVPTAITSASTITPSATSRGVMVTALAVPLSIAAPTGSPYDTQSLLIRIKDDGTARALTWDAIYKANGVTIPTTTTASKTMYIIAVYNTSLTKWDVVSIAREA